MRSKSLPVATFVGVITGLTLTIVGCKTEPSPGKNPRPSLSSNTEVPSPHFARSAKPVPTVSAAPVSKAQVEASVNPSKLPPYSGPTGAIEGTIRIKGDEPSRVELQLPASCMAAGGTYGRLFREGKGRVAPDVLVAVTGYDAYVPEKEEKVDVHIEGCAFSTRTVAMTYGQRIEVINDDPKNSYIPILHGSRYTAFMVAVPKGNPIKLYPHRVGQYELADNMDRPWMKADVFALKFATHDVTDLDGHYRIEGIPVGEVDVNALLPSINASEKKKVEIKAGETRKVDIVLTFDASKFDGKTRPKPLKPASSAPKVPVVK